MPNLPAWLSAGLQNAHNMYTSGNGGKVYTQDMSFIFTEPGQLGIELTRSAVTGVTGQAEKLGEELDKASTRASKQTESTAAAKARSPLDRAYHVR